MASLWKAHEIDADKRYVLAFFEDEQGLRSFKVQQYEIKEELRGLKDLVFLSDEIPAALLLARNLGEISERIRLEGGGCFEFDAHNIWFTKEEADDLESGRRPVRWVRGRCPQLPSR